MWSFALAGLRRSWIFALSFLFLSATGAKNDPNRVLIAAPPTGSVRLARAGLPLSFELNSGQADPRVRFLSRGNGYTLFLTKDEAVLAMQEAEGSLLRMNLVGASAAAKVVGLDELPGKSNYLIGKDPKKWRTRVPNYAKVRYEGVYPGVDLVYYGEQGGQLECDFVVAPGADPRAIALTIAAAKQVGSTQKAISGGQSSQSKIKNPK